MHISPLVLHSPLLLQFYLKYPLGSTITSFGFFSEVISARFIPASFSSYHPKTSQSINIKAMTKTLPPYPLLSVPLVAMVAGGADVTVGTLPVTLLVEVAVQ